MLSGDKGCFFQMDAVTAVTEGLRGFTRASPLNRLPGTRDPIFDEPLVRFADGDDPLFTEYKKIIAESHLTPREALAKAYNKNPEDLPARLSVISWVLPITRKTREANRQETASPAKLWVHTRWHGEKFNDALREYMVRLLQGMGYLATAPATQPFFAWLKNEKGPYSNWSERHIAYAAGHGSFGLSDGFITERGMAHRLGSVVTTLELPVSPRTAQTPYADCTRYAGGKCRACASRCPAGAITEAGHDKVKCDQYIMEKLGHLKAEYDVGITGCGLCQTKVPCEERMPGKK
jgi:epoxyqueuosine reductase